MAILTLAGAVPILEKVEDLFTLATWDAMAQSIE